MTVSVVALGVVAGTGTPATAAPPTAPGSFVSLTPTRVLDTRTGLGGTAPGANGTVSLAVTGHGGVPSTGVAAVVLNVTATASTSYGHVTVYPEGNAQPTASNLNFGKGQTVANQVIAAVGFQGRIRLVNSSPGNTQLIADVAGYFLAGTPSAAGAFVSQAPARVLDTRTGLGGTTPAAQGTVPLQITGRGNVPSDGVAAVVVNVTATASAKGGHVTVYPSGTSQPTASNINFGANATVANLVTVRVGTGGRINLYNSSAGPTQYVADVAGYYLAGTPTAPGTFVPLSPSRVLDTRIGVGGTTPGAQGKVRLHVLGAGGVPSVGVSSVVANVTATASVQGGHVVIYPGGTTRPNVSSINFVANQTVANLVTVPVGGNGNIDLYNSSTGTTQYLADVAGYYLADTAPPDTSPPGPVSGLTASVTSSSVTLSWTNPSDADFAGVTIRRAAGTVAPTSPTAGTLVTDTSGSTHSFLDAGLQSGTTYSYALFAHDGVPNYAAAAIASSTTSSVVDTTPPGPVTSVSSTVTATSVTLTWTNPTTADFAGVTIRRAPGSTAPNSPTAGTAVTNTSGSTHSYTDNGLSPSTQYSYALFARDGVPNYAAGASRTVTTAAAADTTPPGPVTALTTVVTAGSVTLSWTNPTDADFAGVAIRRTDGNTPPTSPGAGTFITNTTGTAHSFPDFTVTAGATYSYALFARDTSSNYAAAATKTVNVPPPPDTTPPGPVTAVGATSTSTSVTLTWTNPTTADFAGVTIRRAPGSTAPNSPTAGTAVTNTSGSTHSYIDNGLSASTQYSYALFAHDAVPNYANAVTTTVSTKAPADTTPPAPVTNLSTTVTSDSVNLSWTNPTTADFAGVTIRRATGVTAPTSATSGTLVATTTGATHTFTDTPITENQTYSYAVFARDSVPNYSTGVTTSAKTTGWLERINAYRLAAGLSPVTAQPAWDKGLQAHFQYLAHVPANSPYRTGANSQYASAHTENPAAKDWYTAEGATQAEQSDLIEGAVGYSPSHYIDSWLAGPFHSIGMLRAGLTQVEFSYDPTTGDGGLNVIGGITGPSSATPVLFPGPGMTTNLTSYNPEFPDPLESCNDTGFQPSSTGLPLYALLPSTPAAGVTASVRTANGTALSTCVVDEVNYHSSDPIYGPIGKEILQGDHVVLVFVKAPYTTGSYTASINQPGQAAITWSFNVGPTGPQSGK